jgi:hypothetical protein
MSIDGKRVRLRLTRILARDFTAHENEQIGYWFLVRLGREVYPDIHMEFFDNESKVSDMDVDYVMYRSLKLLIHHQDRIRFELL